MHGAEKMARDDTLLTELVTTINAHTTIISLPQMHVSASQHHSLLEQLTLKVSEKCPGGRIGTRPS